MSNAEYMREYRRRTKGVSDRVFHRAGNIALAQLKKNYPDLWSDCLDQAWLEITGRKPAQRRPRGSTNCGVNTAPIAPGKDEAAGPNPPAPEPGASAPGIPPPGAHHRQGTR